MSESSASGSRTSATLSAFLSVVEPHAHGKTARFRGRRPFRVRDGRRYVMKRHCVDILVARAAVRVDVELDRAEIDVHRLLVSLRKKTSTGRIPERQRIGRLAEFFLRARGIGIGVGRDAEALVAIVRQRSVGLVRSACAGGFARTLHGRASE